MSKSYETFGKYVLLERLAAGGMAEVFLGKSVGAIGIEKFVAIKRILPQYSDHPEFIEMFKEEAKIAINLNHSNVVSVTDFGIEKSQFFIIMEYVEGQNLRQILNHLKKESKDLTLDQIVYVTKEIASGLDHAHRCLDGTTGRPLNIIHRDMSPQNVMISFEGEVKIVDFGIAKAETQVETTRTGTIKGKFGYMSPEQAEGLPVDLRTDIFSIGIVLWELLAKERLFQANSESATLKKIRDCNVPSLRKINPGIPMELERICNKALAKDKSLRYQSSADLFKDLNRFLNTQYPDFSSRDFSVFMKSIYSQMFLENRKKLSEYAKVQVQMEEKTYTRTERLPDPSSNPEDILKDSNNGSIEHTSTYNSAADLGILSKQLSAGEGHKVIEELDPALFESKSQVIHLNELKGGGDLVPAGAKIKPSATHGNQTQSGVSNSIKKKKKQDLFAAPAAMDGVSWMWMASFVILFSAGAFYLYQTQNVLFEALKCKMGRCAGMKNASSQAPPKNPFENPTPETNPESTTSETETNVSTSTPIVPLLITSQPSGAIVYIDGINRGITPFRGSIEANKSFKIGLVREGFIPYDIPNAIADTSDARGYMLAAKLQPEPPRGYISIDCIAGCGGDPSIYVNGQRLTEKIPIEKYAVPADTPLKIRVVNPFSQLEATETVTVKIGERKSVRLILTRQSHDNR